MTASDRAFKGSKIFSILIWLLVGLLAIALLILIIALGILSFDLDQQVYRIAMQWGSRAGLAVILFLLFFTWFVFRIPPEFQKTKEDEVTRLNDRLLLKEYSDIDVTFRDDPLTDHQLGLLGHASNNFLKLSLRVTNNGGTSIRCSLRMMSLQYNRTGFVQLARWEGDETPSEREDSFTPIETKLMKWDEGFVTEGKIDINSRGGIGNLCFAETAPRPNTNFWFLYIDGKSRNQQSVQGRYWAILQLEGHCERDGKKDDLIPIQYEVEFTFSNGRLDPVKVTKKDRAVAQ